MSWCFKVRGNSYHWIIHLYERLQLPVIPPTVQALQKEVEDHMKEIERRRTAQKKQTRIRMKVARAEEQEATKKWVKRQAVQHTCERKQVCKRNMKTLAWFLQPGRPLVVQQKLTMKTLISGKTCGSNQHQCTTHSACPLNKRSNKWSRCNEILSIIRQNISTHTYNVSTCFISKSLVVGVLKIWSNIEHFHNKTIFEIFCFLLWDFI